MEEVARKEIMNLHEQLVIASGDFPTLEPQAPPVIGEFIAHVGSLIFTFGVIAALLGAVGLFFTRHRERELFKVFLYMSGIGVVLGLVGGVIYLLGGI